MSISNLKLHNFRSYDLYETDLGENGTVIVGPNGMGKTNLLEAVYIALRGSSFRTSLVDCIKHEKNSATILLNTTEGDRRVNLSRSANAFSKEFIINDNKSKMLSAKNRLPVVLFEPGELRLISSSPTRRRDFLDGLIARTNPTYEKNLRIFNRSLLQRNELLKNESANSPSWRDHMFAWDIKFVESASIIAATRSGFLVDHQAKLNDLYSILAGKATSLTTEYQPIVPLVSYEQSLLDKLAKSREYEIATGFTSAGPHREDFQIYLHNQLANKVASRGENRTIMLAFKLLELELQTKIYDQKPIILMDDVFSELDATREKLLQDTINNHQFIITSTDTRYDIPHSLVVKL